jgi:two-component system NtrC family response regulator
MDDIEQDALALLQGYTWPGNVRELENVVERAVILSDRHEIQPGDLPAEVREPRSAAAPDEERLEERGSPRGLPPVPSIGAGERMPDSGFNLRQMRAMDFIKTHGFITNKYYSQLAEISERQALRELSELVDTGKLDRIGKGRACRYIFRQAPAGG